MDYQHQHQHRQPPRRGGRGGYRGGHHHQHQQPQQVDQHVYLTRLLMEISTSGISPSSTTADQQPINLSDTRVRNLKSIIIKDWAYSAENQQVITRVLMACGAEFPDKLPVVGTLVAMVCAESGEIATQLAAESARSLNQHLTECRWRHAKNLLRLCGELAAYGVVEVGTVWAVYEAVAKQLSANTVGPGKLERRDALAEVTMKALPWVSPAMVAAGKQAEVDTFVQVLDVFFAEDGQRAQQRHSALMATSRPATIIAPTTTEMSDDHQQESWMYDHLAQVYRQIKTGLTVGFQSPLLPRWRDVYAPQFAGQLTAVPMPRIHMPLESPIATYPLGWVQCEIFHPSVVSQLGRMERRLPESASFDRFVLYDMLDDLLTFFVTNHSEFIAYFNSNFHQEKIEGSAYDAHQALMEVLFSRIVCLPESELRQAYYSVVVFEMCATFKQRFPSVLGKAFYTMFDRMADFDVEVRARLATWFAHHLSNFEYKWNWKAWHEVLEDQERSTDAQRAFLKDVLEQCTYFSFHERVQKALGTQSTAIVGLLPAQGEPCFGFEKPLPGGGLPEDMEERQAAADLLHEIRLKTPYDVQARVQAMCEVGARRGHAGVDGEQAGMPLARRATIHCVLHNGNKSISHLTSSIERSLEVLKSVVPQESEQAKLHALQCVEEYWLNNRQFMEIVFHKLVGYGVVELVTIVQWLFSKPRDLSEAFVFRLLNSPMARLKAQILGLKEKLDYAKAQQPPQQPANGGDDMRVDSAGAANGHFSVDELQPAVDAHKREQKQLLISTFQLLITQPEVEALFVAFARRQHSLLKEYGTTVESIVFAKAEDPKWRELFLKVKQLHA